MYTPDEVQSAVEKLVRGSIRRPVDPLGTRKVEVGYSDIQEAGATVLLLNTASPFYCLALGAQRLRDAVMNEALVLDRLTAAVLATGRRVLPIKTVDMLFGAKAALEELETASAARNEGFRDISKVPSYQRFDANVQAFLDGPAQNVKANGQVVETPQEARMSIPPLLRQLASAHAELRLRAAKLANGIDDFTKLNLPALVASGAIARARQVIGGHASTMDGQGADERLLSVRDVTLDVLAAKAVVKQFGSFTGPSTFYQVHGVGVPYADSSSHAADPAQVGSSALSSVVLGTSSDPRQFLLMAVDDGSTSTIELDASYAATVNGLAGVRLTSSPALSGWLIGDGTLPAMPSGATTPDNDVLRIQVGAVVYAITLTKSVDSNTARSAQDICNDINSDPLLPTNVRAEPVFSPLEYSGPFNIDDNAGSTTFHVPAGMSDLVALGVKVGHLVHVIDGPNDGLWSILEVTATTLTVEGSFTGEAGRPCEVGPLHRTIRIRCTEPETQIPLRVRLTMLADTTKSANACETLGFFPGIFSECRPTTMDELVAQIHGRTSTVTASTLYLPFGEHAGTSSVSNPFKVILEVPMGVGEYMTLRVLSGPNSGDYFIEKPGDSAYEVILKSPLPVQRDGVNPVKFTVSVGHKKLVIAGKTTGLAAKLSIGGTAAPALFNVDPFTLSPKVAYGTTPYFKLPETPRGLQPGDVLELYANDYANPTSTHVIEAVEPAINVIRISPALSTHLSLEPRRWVFDPKPPPFARLRITQTYDFDVFRKRLLAWLARVPNQAAYFTELSRMVNPLLVNESPTASAVGSAKAAVEALYAFLTQAEATAKGSDPTLTLDFALQKYRVPPVPALDVLLKSYKEKGSDRAVDLLLSGEFGTFFGLSIDEASYAGAMQSAMREVAREDIAVRSTNRADATVPRQLSEADSPDYEYDQSDIEAGAQVDPPGQ